MFRKIFIFLLIGISLQKPTVEAARNLFSGILSTPLNMADGILSWFSSSIFNISSTLTNAATSYATSVANCAINYSRKLTLNVMGGMGTTLLILRNASLEISTTFNQFSKSLSTAKQQFLDSLIRVEKDFVRGSLGDGKLFIAALTRSGQILLKNTKIKYDKIVNDILNLTNDLINEEMKNGNSSKVAALKQISQDINKLQKEFADIPRKIVEAIMTVQNELFNFPINITAEEAEKKLKSMITILKDVWSMGVKNIADIQAQFEILHKTVIKDGGKLSLDIESRFKDCRNQFIEINKDFENFKHKIEKYATTLISEIVGICKANIGTYFNSSVKAFSDSVLGIRKIVGSAADMFGDFMKERMQSIIDDQKIVEGNLGNISKETRNILDKLTDIAKDISFDAGTAVQGVLDITLKRLINIIKVVNGAVEKGGKVIGNVADQTIQLVSKARTEIAGAMQDNIKHIQSIFRLVTETKKSITVGLAGAIKNARENIDKLFFETIERAKESIINKTKLFIVIARQAAGGVKLVLNKISSTIRKFQHSLLVILENCRQEANIKMSSAFQAINKFSDEYVSHLHATFVRGSKNYFYCSKAARENFNITMPSLIQKVRNCGKDILMDVTKKVDSALNLEDGLTPKVEQLVKTYEQCKEEKYSSTIRCLAKLSIEKGLGLPQAVHEIVGATAAAGKHIELCTAEHIEESKRYFSKLRAEFDNCIKQA